VFYFCFYNRIVIFIVQIFKPNNADIEYNNSTITVKISDENPEVEDEFVLKEFDNNSLQEAKKNFESNRFTNKTSFFKKSERQGGLWNLMNNKDPTKTIGVNPGACEG
jgi:hypothetical protein